MPTPTLGASTIVYDGIVLDSVTSPDGLTVYLAGADGAVRAYNAETGALLRTWDVGNRLGAIAISPDGGFLMAVESEPVFTHGDGFDAKTKITTYRIDTATGAVTDYPFIVRGEEQAFDDVAILNDGRAYFSQDFRGSAATSLWALDPATGIYEGVTDKLLFSPSLTTDGDHGRLLISVNNLSAADNYVFDAESQSIVGYHSGFDDDIGGGGYGIQAYSQAADLIVQLSGSHVYAYDSSLHYERDLTEKLSVLLYTTGLAFDRDGTFLYAVDSKHERIIQIATDTWTIVQQMQLPKGAFTYNLTFGEELIVGPDSRYFLIFAGGQYLRIDNPALPDALSGGEHRDTLTGTGDADTLLGFGGKDRLNGLDGDDTINGGAGADTMAGGAGDDRYVVDSVHDRVVEAAGEGYDTVASSVSYRLADNVEALTLTGGLRTDGTGNALANALTGNEANNALDGGGGRDVLLGMGGDDGLVGGTGTDTLTGGTGADTFRFAAGDTAATVKQADVITDFSHADGDRIDLAAIDAIAATPDIDAFHFIGAAAFSGTAGELRYRETAHNTLVMGDTDGDGRADLIIKLTGNIALVASDFASGSGAFAAADSTAAVASFAAPSADAHDFAGGHLPAFALVPEMLV